MLKIRRSWRKRCSMLCSQADRHTLREERKRSCTQQRVRRLKVWYGDIQEGIILTRNLLFNALMSSMLVLICHTPLSTAQTSQAKEPPLPGPIILAKKVFVANGARIRSSTSRL